MKPRPRVLTHAPSVLELERFLDVARRADFSYPERGATRGAEPAGYDHDHNRVRLGAGDACFERARAALERWDHFPPGWSRVHPLAPPAECESVCVAFHVLGLWWLSAARIVYRLDEGVQSSGFAYGTLTCHVERGEECFRVDQEADGSVWYDVRAFSRPGWWPVLLGKPFVRALQRRFVRESQAALRVAVATRMPAYEK